MGFRRCLVVGVIGIVAVGLPEQALASLIGQDVTVRLRDPVFFPDPLDDLIDIVTVVNLGVEILEGDLTNIGGTGLLGGEFIDIGDASIQYMVRGDGLGGTTGFGAGSFYEFSNLFWSGPVPGIITGLSVVLSNVTGVGLGSEVFFTGNSVKLFVDTLVVGDAGGRDLGSITLNLTVDHTAPVSEPSTLLLSLLGLAGLAVRRWRRTQ